MKEIKLGDAVTFVDPHGIARAALVTQVWNQDYINIAFVSGDENRTDSCGRQIERETSVFRENEHNKAGRFFRP